jgi:hypothetical protein
MPTRRSGTHLTAKQEAVAMRIPNPLNRKTLIALGAVAAGVAFWRVRARRREAEDQQFEEEIQGAVQEGAAAGKSAG